MKNKDIKSRMIQSGKYQEYMKKRKLAFQNGEFVHYGKWFDLDYFGMQLDELIECEHLRKNKKDQVSKIKDHMKFLFEKRGYDLYFATFNFKNEILQQTSPETRKQKIRRLLTPCADYILNIDYGKQTNREHYHAIIAIRTGTYELRTENNHSKISCLDEYTYGFYDLERIRTDEPDKEKLSRYMAKLTMHSLKIKQSYVSVKKGSEYQEYKKIENKYKDAQKKQIIHLMEKYEDQMLCLSL